MFKILKIKGFTPYIVVVFLNAFTDLGHKIIIQNTVFKYFDGQTQIILSAIVNALIILPFILLFTPAGFLSDKYPKDVVVKLSAASAVAITGFITISYYEGWFEVAFALTFLLAIQSAFLSPAKYGYIKELTGKENIAVANSFVQATTIVAILFGVFIFSVLYETGYNRDFNSLSDILTSIAPLGFLLIAGTVLQTLLTFKLPRKKQTDTVLSFDRKKYVTGQYLRENLRTIKGNEVIWLSIVGLALFWGINQVLLAAFGTHLKGAANITNTVMVQGLLALAGVGVIIGSLMAGKISQNFIETGLIPAATVGISVSLFLLPTTTNLSVLAVLFCFYGIVGGMFVVPLNSLIQFNAKEEDLGKVLAASNFVQNAVMFSFLALTIFFAVRGITCTLLFHLLFLLALGGTLYTFKKLPQAFVRYLIGLLVSQHYKLQVLGLQNVPSSGGVLMLGNHVSYLDWAVVQMASPRRIRFVMARTYYGRWYLQWFLDFFGVIPISRGASKGALEAVEQYLNQGEVVAIFPEGAVSRNGQLGVFHTGFERAVKNADAVIVPFYLRGLWGSIYSFASPQHREMSRLKMTRDVTVCFGKPMSKATTAPEVKKAVLQLSIYAWQHYTESLKPVHVQWLKTAKKMRSKPSLIDFDGTMFSHYQVLTTAIVLSQATKKRSSTEQNIGLLLPTSSAGIIANLAVLMLGKTVVNLNYTASQENLDSALAQSEIKTIITSERFLTRLEGKGFPVSELVGGKKVLYLETIRSSLSSLSKAKAYLAARVLPAFLVRILYFKKTSLDAVAAILFSSGSEGVPKGITLTHRNIVGNIKQVAGVLNAQEDDVMLDVLPLFHAFGLTVTSLMPLVEGMPLIAHPDPTNACAIGKLAVRHNATLLCATSTFLRIYTKNKKVHPLMFRSLRMVVAGAEKVGHEVRTAFKAKFGLDIYEGYGTTETTPVVSVNLPDVLVPGHWSVHQGNKEGTVGLPLPGSAFRIVDPETFEELPAGEAGLILIGGTQIMRGYLNDDSNTHEAIIEQDGIRWYKSGDKGRVDEDGFLAILDRYSRFAKIGGEMISLGAIEEAVEKVVEDETVEIAAVALPDEKKGEKVALLVSGKKDPTVLKQKLIEHEVSPLLLPDAYIGVDAIPKLGSGKKDLSKAKAIALSYV